jgi:hypothetical protein
MRVARLPPSASSVPSRDIEVSRSHAADERAFRGIGEPCSRDRQQRLLRIVVAVVAVCAAILLAAAIVRIGRMKSDRPASLLEKAEADGSVQLATLVASDGRSPEVISCGTKGRTRTIAASG